MLTISPTMRLGTIIDATISTINIRASLNISNTTCGVILVSPPHIPKLLAKVPITMAQPSTRINNINLNGNEIIIGDNIIMPMDMRTLATTRSMIRKGINSRNPI